MATVKTVFNVTRNEILLPRGIWTASPWGHFKGLMLKRTLPADEGLIFVYKRESRMDTSIHMFFCFFPISVIWLDKSLRVVDAKLAKPWRPYYAAQKPAQYFIEANPALLEHVAIGDQLRFDSPMSPA